ncbi:alpha/beta hydrolase [bacterium]|nr:alpha/beta hydrolase [bacterium]
MKKLLSGFILFFITCSLYAQQTVAQLYNGTAPGSENWTQKEVEYTQYGGKMVRNVVNPTLTVFLPEESKATGAAVIVAPGGGFCWLSWENEGTLVGEWLQAHGIAAFILKYRLADMGQTEEELQKNSQAFMQPVMSIANSSNPEEELQKYSNVARVIALAQEDGRQAIKYVRANAAEYKVNPDRIGLMGFSAGGILTIGVALHHDAESRPDFIAPIYGIALNNLVVPADAAPMFFACAADDGIVAAQADKLYTAWKSAGKSIEFHVYSKGGHGFGMRKQGLPIDNWIEQFGEWLDTQGFLKP